MVWTVPGRGEWVVQLHASRGASRDAAQGLCCVMARLTDYRARLTASLDFLDERDLQDLLLAPIARDLITAALTIAFGDNLRWEWGLTSGPQAILAPRRKARDLVSDEIRATISRPDAGARRAELELLYNMLLGFPNQMALASIANVRGFVRDERVPVVEIDCVVVEERRRRLAIHLGEAKTGSGSANAARTQLRAALGRLSVDASAIVEEPMLVKRALRANQLRARSRATTTVRL